MVVWMLFLTGMHPSSARHTISLWTTASQQFQRWAKCTEHVCICSFLLEWSTDSDFGALCGRPLHVDSSTLQLSMLMNMNIMRYACTLGMVDSVPVCITIALTVLWIWLSTIPLQQVRNGDLNWIIPGMYNPHTVALSSHVLCTTATYVPSYLPYREDSGLLWSAQQEHSEWYVPHVSRVWQWGIVSHWQQTIYWRLQHVEQINHSSCC